jgi:AraC family transcriptional activator of tynA and feaB
VVAGHLTKMVKRDGYAPDLPRLAGRTRGRLRRGGSDDHHGGIGQAPTAVLGGMSQACDLNLDPASHGGGADGRRVAGTIVELTTDGIAPSERLSYWRDGVLRRMEPIAALGEDRPFQGRLRRIIGLDSELIEHASDAVLAVRTPQRCRADGCDDISIDLMLDCRTATLDHGGERSVRSGDLCVMDYARPAQVVRSRHRALGIILSRQRVREVLGGDPSALVGRRLPARGIGALLQSHMRLTLAEAPHMTPAQRTVAIAAAADMALAALAALAAESDGKADVEQHGEGFYQAARRIVDQDCANPDLTPDIVATSLGCSRASLYRAFFRHGESVAAVIWATRLDRAWRMLTSSSHLGLLVSEVAFRSGFVDQPTFNRMFKRRYGLTPREAREQGQDRAQPQRY